MEVLRRSGVVPCFLLIFLSFTRFFPGWCEIVEIGLFYVPGTIYAFLSVRKYEAVEERWDAER